MKTLMLNFKVKVLAEEIMESFIGADAILILTEWENYLI